jgi:hypothetical protein
MRMSKNFVEPERPQMTTWRRVERVAMLCYTYIASRVFLSSQIQTCTHLKSVGEQLLPAVIETKQC